MLRCGPLRPQKLSLVLSRTLRNNARMPPDLTALFLLAGALSVVTIAVVVYIDFSRPETRFTLVVTVVLVYALLTLTPVVFLPSRQSWLHRLHGVPGAVP